MPLACLPIEIAGRNRMWRAMAIEAIRSDPAWADGDYTAEPLQGLRTAESLLQIAGSAPLYAAAKPIRRARRPTPIIDRRAEAASPTLDANDLIYQLEASRNYDPSPELERDPHPDDLGQQRPTISSTRPTSASPSMRRGACRASATS